MRCSKGRPHLLFWSTAAGSFPKYRWCERFTGTSTLPVSPGRMRRAASVDLHALRHTFGTLLARSGVAPRTAMDLMRHADIRLTTAIYQHLDLVDTAGAVNMLPVVGAETARKTGTYAEKE